MFTINTNVSYGAIGACRITGIEKRKLHDTEAEYYILKPFFQRESIVYVPVDCESLTSKMRPLLTKDQIAEVISAEPDTEWIVHDGMRANYFKTKLHDANRSEIVKIIKQISRHGTELEKSGKKLRASDANIMKDAATAVYNELALLIEIKPEQIIEFVITGELK